MGLCCFGVCLEEEVEEEEEEEGEEEEEEDGSVGMASCQSCSHRSSLPDVLREEDSGSSRRG